MTPNHFARTAIQKIKTTVRAARNRTSTRTANKMIGALDAPTLELIIGELASPGIILLDQKGDCVFSNPGWHQISGTRKKQTLTHDWLNAINVADVGRVHRGCLTAIREQQPFETECRLARLREDKRQTWVNFLAKPLRDKNGSFGGCLGTFTDITDQKITNESLEQLTLHDPLTSLPNRSLLMRHLQASLDPKANNRLALVFIDLDGFKLINDTLGHTLGNQLILEVSERIKYSIKPGDLLARLGSDEFIVVVQEDECEDRANQVAKEILNAIKKPILVDNETVYISASAGIALSKHGITADRLIQQADVAMYNAKKRNGNTVQFHSHEFTAQNRAKLIVSSHLHTALEQNEFSVHYQPQLDIASNTICGSEALLRWKNPQLGTISPTVFIPLLEDRGLINQVGEWVLSQACHMQAKWQNDYSTHSTTVSVNVSSIQLHDRHFLNKLKKILDSSGISPDCLVLEITETVLLDEYVTECNLLQDISALGVKIAIDDFGTGYGSFLYLKKHPIDHVKIDRSFISNLFNCEENKAITNSIIDLSHKLGKTVIAEGVDKQEELDFLMMRGCDIYQGFLSSKALPSNDFATKFLQPTRYPQAV